MAYIFVLYEMLFFSCIAMIKLLLLCYKKSFYAKFEFYRIMDDLSKYVRHFIGDEDGCGVFVGDLFITAGHCLEDDPTIKFTFEGVTHVLNREDALFRVFNEKDPNGLDLAIFRVPGIMSPLKFEKYTPKLGDKLKSISYRHWEENDETGLGTIIHYDIIDCIAESSGDVEGNYYAALTDVSLKPGSSGSPAFLDGKIVGILHGGNNKGNNEPYNKALPLNMCYYLSSNAIIKVLESL